MKNFVKFFGKVFRFDQFQNVGFLYGCVNVLDRLNLIETKNLTKKKTKFWCMSLNCVRSRNKGKDKESQVSKEMASSQMNDDGYAPETLPSNIKQE